MMMENTGEDEANIYSRIHSPQYFMATPDSTDSVRPGGLADQIIEEVSSDFMNTRNSYKNEWCNH